MLISTYIDRVRFQSPPPIEKIVSFKGRPFTIHDDIPKEYITSAENVKSDGWCGYRAVAALLYGDQERYMDVKAAMLRQVQNNVDFYRRYWCVHKVVYEDMMKRLQMLEKRSSVTSEYWFDAAIDLQIVADAFQRPFAFYSDDSKVNLANRPTLYIPFFYDKDKSSSRRVNHSPLIVHFLGRNHFAAIHIRRSISTITWPPINERFALITKERGYDSHKVVKSYWSHLKIADPYPPSPYNGAHITIHE